MKIFQEDEVFKVLGERLKGGRIGGCAMLQGVWKGRILIAYDTLETQKTCHFEKGMDRYLDRAEGEGIYV